MLPHSLGGGITLHCFTHKIQELLPSPLGIRDNEKSHRRKSKKKTRLQPETDFLDVSDWISIYTYTHKELDPLPS